MVIVAESKVAAEAKRLPHLLPELPSVLLPFVDGSKLVLTLELNDTSSVLTSSPRLTSPLRLVTPTTFNVVPTNNALPIPTPPAVTIDPTLLEVES